MEKRWEKPGAEALLLGIGTVLCAVGGAMEPGWLSWLGGACLLGGGLLSMHRCRTLREENGQLQQKLTEEKAAAVRREAEIRERARDEMENNRSTLSHGLRMPIAVIQGYADLLRGGLVPDPEVQKEYVEKIYQRSQYMVELLSRKKKSDSRVEGGRLDLDKQDLIGLVQEICTDLHSYSAEHEIKIQVLHSLPSLQVEVDKYLISRVLYNLLENAAKYMGRPGVVTVRVWSSGNKAVLDVQDDGMGMPTEEVEHIFDLHFQGSNRVGGQGHGLYLVKQAVEAHHGGIEAHSAPGRGLGIRITLPMEQPVQTEENVPENPEGT